jgi:hypothetical protein
LVTDFIELPQGHNSSPSGAIAHSLCPQTGQSGSSAGVDMLILLILLSVFLEVTSDVNNGHETYHAASSPA